MRATTREAVARNEERAGRARVPKVAIFTVAKRLDPPAVDEGFDAVCDVLPGVELHFDVVEATPAAGHTPLGALTRHAVPSCALPLGPYRE